MFFWGVYVPTLLPAFVGVVMAWIITCILTALIWPASSGIRPFFSGPFCDLHRFFELVFDSCNTAIPAIYDNPRNPCDIVIRMMELLSAKRAESEKQ
jgi:hypothetical protein